MKTSEKLKVKRQKIAKTISKSQWVMVKWRVVLKKINNHVEEKIKGRKRVSAAL